jgi:hypothetical protein
LLDQKIQEVGNLESETYVLRLPPELKATIEEHAAKMKRSVAEEIRHALREYYGLPKMAPIVFGLALIADNLGDLVIENLASTVF